MVVENQSTGRFIACQLLMAVVAVALLGCKNSSQAPGNSQANRPIQVTVTVGMLGDLVRQVGGEHVEVTQLMGTGVDPHLYKPTRDDSVALSRADIIFYNGMMLEGKMGTVLKNPSGRAPSIAVAELIPKELLTVAEAEGGHPDPHVWMDVSLWREATAQIAKELAKHDPPHSEEYHNSANSLMEELDQLHKYGLEMMRCIPQKQRVLVTSHDAFRYFGAAYGIEVEAVQGISTESGPSVGRTLELVDMLVERDVQAVFTESSVPKDFVEALLAGAKDRGHMVANADSLFSDAMGRAGDYTGTYIGMMDHNLTTIASALGCPNVPEKGFRGWTNGE